MLVKKDRRRWRRAALLGTPETSLSGLRTLMALSVLRSTPLVSSSSPPPDWLAGLSGVSVVMYLKRQRYQTAHYAKIKSKNEQNKKMH